MLVTRDFPKKPKPFNTYLQEKYNKVFGQIQSNFENRRQKVIEHIL